MMEYKDYYKILGVSKNADDKTIKTAYRRLARKHHPDVNKGSSERFKEISEAYEVLSDPEKRKRYDSLGPDWQRYAQPGTGGRGPSESYDVRFGSGGDLGGFSEFFRTIFGDLGGARFGRVDLGDLGRGEFGGRLDFDLGDLGTGGFRSPDKGQDVETSIDVTLEEAFRGARKTFALEVDEPCATCRGAGHVSGKACATCRGSGWTKGRRHLEVKIPPGVDTGSRVRVAGEGPGGMGGGRRGDLYLKVRVTPHPHFERKGDDLYLDLPLHVADAALGAEVQVPTLKGPVSMKIPPETSGGKSFRLPGYGMPRLKGGGSGDQYVRVQLGIPARLGSRERELFKELKTLRPEIDR
jgi:DnaJ-class molecular chaperone